MLTAEMIAENNRKAQEENARKIAHFEQRALQAKLIKAANDWNTGCGLDKNGNTLVIQAATQSRWAKNQTLSQKLSRLPGANLPQPRKSREEMEDHLEGAYLNGTWTKFNK